MLLARVKADYWTQKESKSYAEIAEAKVVDFYECLARARDWNAE